MVDLPYLGRRGTLALSTALTGVFLLASTTARTSDALLGWNCAYSFVSNVGHPSSASPSLTCTRLVRGISYPVHCPIARLIPSFSSLRLSVLPMPRFHSWLDLPSRVSSPACPVLSSAQAMFRIATCADGPRRIGDVRCPLRGHTRALPDACAWDRERARRRREPRVRYHGACGFLWPASACGAISLAHRDSAAPAHVVLANRSRRCIRAGRLRACSVSSSCRELTHLSRRPLSRCTRTSRRVYRSS
jgi:hypothetical protein